MGGFRRQSIPLHIVISSLSRWQAAIETAITKTWCGVRFPIRGDRLGSRRHSHPTMRPNCAELNTCPFVEFSLNDIQKQVCSAQSSSVSVSVGATTPMPFEQTTSNSAIAE